jgi:hypothetical protein
VQGDPVETATPPRGALSRFPSPQGYHIVRRVQGALDLRCEGLECVALLPAEGVPVVDARPPGRRILRECGYSAYLRMRQCKELAVN